MINTDYAKYTRSALGEYFRTIIKEMFVELNSRPDPTSYLEAADLICQIITCFSIHASVPTRRLGFDKLRKLLAYHRTWKWDGDLYLMFSKLTSF